MDFTRIIQKNTKNKLTRQNYFKLYCLFFIFCSLTTKGQSGPDFNMLADKAFLKLYQNPDECISYTEGILVSDQNGTQNCTSKYYFTSFCHEGNMYNLSIFSLKKEPDQKNDLSYCMQVFSDYNLADQYQNLGLYNQSKKIISHLLSDQKLLKSNSPALKLPLQNYISFRH